MEEETVANQILEVVRLNPECTLEELTQWFRQLNWSDVFYEVHKLNRSGQVQLTQNSLGLTTTLRVP